MKRAAMIIGVLAVATLLAAQQQQTQQQVPVCYDIGSEGSLRLAYGELKYWTRPAPMLDSLDG